jgi:aldehyde dehydrogenase (NAD+)
MSFVHHAGQFFIDGAWVAPTGTQRRAVIDPSTETPFAEISMGEAADVDRAVAAARTAFPAFAATAPAERVALLRRLLVEYDKRAGAVAEIMSREMGAPIGFARDVQAAMGSHHLRAMIEVLEHFEFETRRGTTILRREPIGVCALITPWNWPINQIVCKVAPALAAGWTMVLKPSEIAPLNALIWAEACEAAGVPKGVFNLVNGDGPTVGMAMASHPGVDMISITGSTRAGVAVATAAAPTVKRVHQELGGKSANILLPDVDLEEAVARGTLRCFRNSGQSCAAPTRMFVSAGQYDDALRIAKATAETLRVGPPSAADTDLGPVVSEAQFDKIQRLIKTGLDEGARLVHGGPGRPDGLERGYYAKPTVFAEVAPNMTIARKEIFGPVLSIFKYNDLEEAIELANDTVYGLAAYVQSADIEQARRVAGRLQAGVVHLNNAAPDFQAPFGGYKQSGNGKECGELGLDEFLEKKAVIGYV